MDPFAPSVLACTPNHRTVVRFVSTRPSFMLGLSFIAPAPAALMDAGGDEVTTAE